MAQPVLTKAQQLAAQFAQSQLSEIPPDPALNPAWHDRAKVPSPPRRDKAPKILTDGQDEYGRETFAVSDSPVAPAFPDGAGSSRPSIIYSEFLAASTDALFVPEAVRQTPTWKAAGSQEVIDKRAMEAAGQVVYLVERAPDEALKYFRRVLSHPQTGIFVFAQIDESVRDELSATFMRIALRKPWVFQVCRLLLAIRGHVSGPNLFRAICSLAAHHAFLAYADVVSPFGHLEDAARADLELTAEEQEEKEKDDIILEAFLKDAPDLTADKDRETHIEDQPDVPGDSLEDVVGPDSADEVRVKRTIDLDAGDDYMTEEEVEALTDDELDELTKPKASD